MREPLKDKKRLEHILDAPIENSPIPPTTVADNSLKLDPKTIVPQEEAE